VSTHAPPSAAVRTIEQTRWRIDPARSTVEFQVPHFWGLKTVEGQFGRYEGTLDLSAEPAVELRIDAASLDTKRTARDKHLRSADFFDVEKHPQVRFESDHVELDAERLNVYGRLHAAGKKIPLEVAATLRPLADELELTAATCADQCRLGMTWSPLRMTRAPSKLIIRGRLIPDDRTLRA
jgi:polyisoprenoid-binding protein YceI